MSGIESLQDKEEQPTVSLIQQIKDGTVAAETLTRDLRQRCVEVFLSEGYTIITMAQILKRSEKTIKRDIEDIRERNAIAPDINLAKKIVGELLMYARINRDYLMKIARTKDASVSEKAQSEYYAFRILADLIGKFQSLGYLPTKPQEVVGDIFHHVESAEEEASFAELKTMLADIVNTARAVNTLTPELAQEAEKIRLKIEKSEVISQMRILKERNAAKEKDDEKPAHS